MRVTTRKALRDLRRQRGSVTAVAVTVMLGVGLFIASAGAFANLSASYQHTYDRLGFADLIASGGNPEQVAAAASDAGATTVTVRTQADLPMLIAGTKLLGRAIGLPDDARPGVDDVDVIAGSYLSPTDPTGVLLERHAAETFGLAPGDTLQIQGQGWQTVTVRGIVVSAEYLWPARSRQDVLADPHSFAVVFAPEKSVRAWLGAGPNQVLALLPDGPQDPSASAVTSAMRGAGAVDVTTQADQASDATLQLDLDGFSQMAVAFPLLFLVAAAVAAYVMLARRVLAERPIIGSLMAAGARRGRVIRHYLLQGSIIGATGAVAGIALAIVATGAVTRAYTAALEIPDTIVAAHPPLWVLGLLFGLAVGLLGAAAPAITAARTAPAAAMRNEITARAPGRWSRAVTGLPRVPVTVRMALRDVTRSWRRTGATALGAVLALVLVLASVGMMTSMVAALRVQYDQVELQDATVGVEPDAVDSVATDLAALDGVTAVERSVIGQVTVASGGQSYATVLQGFVPDTRMHGWLSTDGTWGSPPTTGILAGAALADELGVHVGDTVTVTTADGSSAQTTIEGFVDEPLGTLVYATNEVAGGLLGAAGGDALLAGFAPDADRDVLRQQITGLPGVVTYSDAGAVVSSLDAYLGLFWAFIGVMVALGTLLALAIIYVTTAVNVVERTNELATLRAAGVPVRRVGGMLATENLLATMIGVPLGLALGWVAADRFLALFTSDLFQLPLTLGWWALVLAALGVLLAALLSQWPAVRAVARLDVARVVRERAL